MWQLLTQLSKNPSADVSWLRCAATSKKRPPGSRGSLLFPSSLWSSFPRKQPVFNPLQCCACGVILAFENMVSTKPKHTCVCMSNIEAGSIWGYTLGFHFTRTATAAPKSGQCNHARKQHRHSIAGVLPMQRTQSGTLPPPANGQDQSQLALRKVMSDGPVKPEGGEQKGPVQSTQQECPPKC